MGKIVGLDFDGTCVTDEYPNVGADIGAVPYIKEMVERGHKIILWTVRSGVELRDAVNWFKANGIKLAAINENLPDTNYGRKVYANFYIDDRAVGTPLRRPYPRSLGKPYVDWIRLHPALIEAGLL